MKIAIIGSRQFDDYNLLKRTVLILFSVDNISCVVSGGAYGADMLGERFANQFNIPTKIYKPNWSVHGKGAGMIRNKDIIEDSDYVFAFWDGKSKGTLNSIKIANKLNKPIICVRYNENFLMDI